MRATKSERRGPRQSSNLRVHVLVLFTLLSALVVAAGLATPSGGPVIAPLMVAPPPFAVQMHEPETVDPPVDTGDEDALYVPSIDLFAPIVNIEMDTAGVLSPPGDTQLVGWWQRSAEPGATSGQTVITGHTVHSGGGVMNRLGELGAGDVIRVRDDDQVIEYRVTDIATLSTAEVAEHAVPLFAQDREEGRLVLVTCTDWVDGDYLSNIIVVADPVRT